DFRSVRSSCERRSAFFAFQPYNFVFYGNRLLFLPRSEFLQSRGSLFEANYFFAGNLQRFFLPALDVVEFKNFVKPQGQFRGCFANRSGKSLKSSWVAPGMVCQDASAGSKAGSMNFIRGASCGGDTDRTLVKKSQIHETQ
ncbi:MAG: hypothetical protein WA439_17060, partial [Pseudolabrys sp.]